MRVLWNTVDEALLTSGSRASAIKILWRQVPDSDRTPARRKLAIALVDYLREHVANHGQQPLDLSDIEPVVIGDPQ